jgi:hypothetical protein
MWKVIVSYSYKMGIYHVPSSMSTLQRSCIVKLDCSKLIFIFSMLAPPRKYGVAAVKYAPSCKMCIYRKKNRVSSHPAQKKTPITPPKNAMQKPHRIVSFSNNIHLALTSPPNSAHHPRHHRGHAHLPLASHSLPRHRFASDLQHRH